MRREWIEMKTLELNDVLLQGLPPCGGSGLKYKSGNLEITGTGSPSMRREWIEIYPVLLEMEGLFKSPSMRREWIEMSADIQPLRTVLVSLHAEGVD